MEYEPYIYTTYLQVESITLTMTHWKIALQKWLDDLLCVATHQKYKIFV